MVKQPMPTIYRARYFSFHGYSRVGSRAGLRRNKGNWVGLDVADQVAGASRKQVLKNGEGVTAHNARHGMAGACRRDLKNAPQPRLGNGVDPLIPR